MRNRTKLIVGIILMVAAIGGANLEVNTKWHYFGNGVLFGVGVVIFIASLKSMNAKTTSGKN